VATDQEMTIIDVILAAIDRLPHKERVGLLGGLFVKACVEAGIERQSMLRYLDSRFDDYHETFGDEPRADH
jgi:hypothetical protein